MRRCCQHRACIEWDQYELHAMSERVAEEVLERLRDVERRIEVLMMSAVVRVDWSKTKQ
jgi:hypothetical protein